MESVLGRHASLMADAGHRVRIIAGRGQQTDDRIEFHMLPEMDSRHPEVLRIKAELDAGRIPDTFGPLVTRLAAQLYELLEDADCVIAHNICSLNKNLALTAALHRVSQSAGSAHLILWHHDLAWTTPRYRSELHEGYPWDLLRTDWPWATQVVVSAERRAELADLLAVAPGRIGIIPNGIDVRSFLKLERETEILRQSLELSLAEPLLLLPVRITPRKNIELGLSVLAELRREFPRAALIVTGPPGPHNPANQQYFESLKVLRADLQLQSAAHFLAEIVDHSIPDSVVADLYRLADALLLPSREEGFGIPLLEAALARIPVFCSDLPVLRELGGDRATYFLPEDNPAEIARRVSALLAEDRAYGFRKQVLRDSTWEQIYKHDIAPLLAGE